MRITGYFRFGLVFSSLFLLSCGGGSTSTTAVTNTPTTPITSDPVTPDPVTPEPNLTEAPNILLIISDDQGLDASAQYSYSSDIPNTPNLDTLANQGVVFENAWATPACTTTRATLITGKYGQNTGVTYIPALLTNEHQILQTYIDEQVPAANYKSAVFGKWHLGGGNSEASHPNDLGIEYYAGNLANVADYVEWELTVNGSTSTSNEYHTTQITNLAADWISQQSTPWFAWVAYSAPHSPFHLPPQALHNRDLSGSTGDINANPRDYYLAAIEAMDTEIGRLIDGLSDSVRENTLIIFLGDNGTPARVIDTSVYGSGHGKGSLYQGGVAVPLFVSGAGVSRSGERETGLVTATDLFATIAQLAGSQLTNVHDSYSFAETLTNAQAELQSNIFTQFESASTTGIAVRNQSYKLIEYADGLRELFLLANDFSEINDLVNDPSTNAQLENLLQFSNTVTPTDNGSPINITNASLSNNSGNCASYVAAYTAEATDVARDLIFIGNLSVEVNNGKCIFTTNAIPNHDFNDGGTAFPNNVSEQNNIFEITATPATSATPTELTLGVDNAILLNGVKVDLLAAGCFGVGDGKIGCNDMSTPWRFDPMHAANGFRVDSHNAHAQPDGTYHYHGSPFALFADDSTQTSPVIGFAADGYPIYGSYVDEALFTGNQGIRKATSSYRLKEGARLNSDGSVAEPGGSYDGAFRDDYEYVPDLGDLDQCNGMTIDGQYGYFITDNYPYVLACYTGTPDASFNK
jgi:arylsulfatase A-like enzyme